MGRVSRTTGHQDRPSAGQRSVARATGGPQGDLDEGADPLVELQVGLLECRQPLGVGALDLGRVLEAPVERVATAREDGARLTRPVADGDDVVERLAEELLDRLAARRDQSIPASARTRIVYGFTPLGSVPAEKTSKSEPPSRPRTASAIWLRALLPVQTKRTRIGASGMGRSFLLPRARPAAAIVASRSMSSPSRRSRSSRWRAIACALVGDQRREVAVDLAVLEAQPRHPAGVLGTEPEPTQADDQAQAGEVLVGVLAVAVGLPGGRRQDADRLVPADGRRRDTGAFGEFRDLHAADRTPSSHLKVKRA